MSSFPALNVRDKILFAQPSPDNWAEDCESDDRPTPRLLDCVKSSGTAIWHVASYAIAVDDPWLQDTRKESSVVLSKVPSALGRRISWTEERRMRFVEEELEYDIVVRMPPRRRYTIRLDIKSVRKASPKIIDPDGGF